jgi:ankyrin repeat protein
MMRLTHLCAWLILPLLSVASLAAVGGGDPLIDAVKRGDKAAVRALLRQPVNAWVTEADGTTALHWAVQRDDPETLDLLIRAGGNVKAVNRYGVTPLLLASVNGNPAVIEILLKAGADPNSALPTGETALMTAARTGQADALRALIAHGADLNATEPARGQTALMWAAAEGNVAAIKVLVEHGADMKTREKGGWTALLFAVRGARTDAVRALLDAGGDVNEAVIPPAGGRGRGAGAGLGAGGGRRGGAGPAGGPSAMMVAVSNAHYELASFLLDKGADPNAAAQGWTALHSITSIRKPGQTAGPAPKGSGNLDSLEFVRKLVAHGANVNARTTRRPNVSGPTALSLVGATPFLMAARTGDAQLMRLLVELGADPSLPNEDGTTPLLAAAGVGTASPGEDAGLEPDCLEAVKLALALGNDVNAVDKNGNTVMHGAAFKQMPSVVKFLAENGAKVETWNRKNVSGWTPLRIAVGVHRGMNFRFSEPTADALRQVMTAAGVSTEVEPEGVISGATETK